MKSKLTFEAIMEDAKQCLQKATSIENGKETYTSAYMKKYNKEEVDVIAEHLKNLKGDELMKDLGMVLDHTANTNESDPSFKKLMVTEYKNELIQLLNL